MSETTRRVGRAAILVAAGILISRALGLARDVVIADRLGDTPLADAYTAAFILPNYLNYLLAGGFLAITFIPILSRHLAAGDTDGAARAFGAVYRPVALMIVLLTALGIVLAEPIVNLLLGSGDRLDAGQLAEVTRLTRLVLPAQVFFVLGGLFTAVQYAQGRFLIPTLAPIIYNAGIIIGGLAAGGNPPSATGFIVGAVAGAFLGNFALQWWGARRTGLRIPGGTFDFRDPSFKEYLLLAIPLMVGQSIVVLDESVGTIFAALADEGSIYRLSLARRFNMLPVGVIAQAAGVAAYPFFARLVAEGRFSEMRDTMGRTIRSVIYVSGMAVAVVIAVTQPAIRVAFQHGAFSQTGTVVTAAALVAYSLSIPAWGVHQIFARGFYAHRQMWVPVVAGTAWTVAAIPVFLLGFDLFGVPGLAAASTVSISGYALTLAVLWRRRHGSEGLGGSITTALRAAVGSAVGGFVGWLVASAITGGMIPSVGTGVLAVAGGGGAAVVTYGVVTWLIGSEELRTLARK